MTTRSFKRGAIWQIDFKEKGDFRQKICAVSPFVKFSPKNWLAGTILELSVVKISFVLIYRVQPGYIAVFFSQFSGAKVVSIPRQTDLAGNIISRNS